MELNVTDLDLSNRSQLPCSGADDFQLNWYLAFAWWLEGMLQLVTGITYKYFFSFVYDPERVNKADILSSKSSCVKIEQVEKRLPR